MENHEERRSADNVQLERRMGHLEASVESLRQDSMRQQAAIASVATHIDNIVETIHTIDTKLDQQRTRRPEIGGIAAVATVLVMIIVALGAVINDKINSFAYTTTDTLERLEVVVDTAITGDAYNKASLEATKERLNRLEERVNREQDK